MAASFMTIEGEKQKNMSTGDAAKEKFLTMEEKIFFFPCIK
jgi:hypothetical protein